MTASQIVTGDGLYPSEAGEEYHAGTATLTVPRRKGASLRLEYSRDGGATWEGVPLNSHEYRRHLNVAGIRSGPPLRVRVAVSGFKGQFALWLEGRP